MNRVGPIIGHYVNIFQKYKIIGFMLIIFHGLGAIISKTSVAYDTKCFFLAQAECWL